LPSRDAVYPATPFTGSVEYWRVTGKPGSSPRLTGGDLHGHYVTRHVNIVIYGNKRFFFCDDFGCSTRKGLSGFFAKEPMRKPG
jgi:hypothetical protein